MRFDLPGEPGAAAFCWGRCARLRPATAAAAFNWNTRANCRCSTTRSLVAHSNDFGNYVELRLAPGADAQHLLERAMRTAEIRRFEMVEPSLEEIFIDTVESTKVVTSHA